MDFSDVKPEYVKVAAFLRSHPQVPTRECIMAEKRVDIFKGSSAINALLSPSYAKTRGVPKIESVEGAQQVMQILVDNGLALGARQINQSRFFQPDLNLQWNDNALYAWVYEGSQFWVLLGAAAFLMVASAIMMFPLWPYSIRSKASNGLNLLMYGSIGIVVFLLALSVVRMIIYLITVVTIKPGLWIFPNLWEDCGVLESFVPLYAWEQVSSDPDTKTKTAPKETESSKNK